MYQSFLLFNTQEAKKQKTNASRQHTAATTTKPFNTSVFNQIRWIHPHTSAFNRIRPHPHSTASALYCSRFTRFNSIWFDFDQIRPHPIAFKPTRYKFNRIHTYQIHWIRLHLSANYRIQPCTSTFNRYFCRVQLQTTAFNHISNSHHIHSITVVSSDINCIKPHLTGFDSIWEQSTVFDRIWPNPTAIDCIRPH